MSDPHEELIRLAGELVDSVSFDINGALIGNQWVGGHGGLISQKTQSKADEVRRVISRLDGKPTWRDMHMRSAGALDSVRAMIGEIFGPVIESEEATLTLRGPEPKHTAEAIFEALNKIKERYDGSD